MKDNSYVARALRSKNSNLGMRKRYGCTLFLIHSFMSPRRGNYSALVGSYDIRVIVHSRKGVHASGKWHNLIHCNKTSKSQPSFRAITTAIVCCSSSHFNVHLELMESVVFRNTLANWAENERLGKLISVPVCFCRRAHVQLSSALPSCFRWGRTVLGEG